MAVIGSHSQLDEFNDLTCALGKRLNSAGEVPEDVQSAGAGATWAVLPALCPWCVSSSQYWHSAEMEEVKLTFHLWRPVLAEDLSHDAAVQVCRTRPRCVGYWVGRWMRWWPPG